MSSRRNYGAERYLAEDVYLLEVKLREKEHCGQISCFEPDAKAMLTRHLEVEKGREAARCYPWEVPQTEEWLAQAGLAPFGVRRWRNGRVKEEKEETGMEGKARW